MTVKIIVFDFDGTLVDSNQIKYDAFFELFPRDNFHKRIIKDILEKYLEESRYIIIRKILERIGSINDINGKENDVADKVKLLAERYNNLVVDGVKHCKVKSGAMEALKLLSTSYRLYLSSTTPESSLKEVVRYRKWDSFFCDIFGYPRDKVSTLLEIITRESIKAGEILVVGDGNSDKDSALTVGCNFLPVRECVSLEKLMSHGCVKYSE